MLLRDIAHARTGDKGDISNISVIVHSLADFERVRREVTAERVTPPPSARNSTKFSAPSCGNS